METAPTASKLQTPGTLPTAASLNPNRSVEKKRETAPPASGKQSKSNWLTWLLTILVFVTVLGGGLWASGAFEQEDELPDFFEWREEKLSQLDCLEQRLLATPSMKNRTDLRDTIALRRSELSGSGLRRFTAEDYGRYERLFEVLVQKLRSNGSLHIEGCL